MAKEVTPAQALLFTGELHETASSALIEAPPTIAVEEDCQESEPPISTHAISHTRERETPQVTRREVRAARSLLYNRLLLEVIQRRIEKAEAIVLSFLLMQDEATAQIGPYLVEIDTTNSIAVTKTDDDDGWKQPYFPEIEKASREV